MSDKTPKSDFSSELNQDDNKSGLYYDDVPPEVYEDGDQIKVSDLLDIIWAGKFKIVIITFILFGVAIFHYVTAPEEYEANSRFLPERQVQQFQMDRMFAFGELARSLNIGGGQQDGSLPSYFYPDIIASIDFQTELLNREVDLYNDGRTITLFEYFTNVYEQPFRARVYSAIKRNTIGLPMRFFQFIANIFKREEEPRENIRVRATETVDANSPSIAQHAVHQDRYFIISPQFETASQAIINRILVNYGTLTIEVTTTMPDPMAAVQINAYVADMLQDYLIDYRIEKARDNLLYIEALYEEAEERYENTSQNLAIYEDTNKGNTSAVADLDRERLRERKNLAYSLYTSVASRLEEARTRLKEDTPIFTTFEDPLFPTNPTGGNIMILPASIFIGLFLGIIWVFFEKLFIIFGRTFSWFKNMRLAKKE